ncbi:hypothetical protein B0T25DRAFT_586090 [Lasiosphaeria hispida]|uniref:Uncharacterized protein n=1 Tax=Lasiosphaeria hispida TaxID=260671 RepID=A0AAJ0H7I4_9PEZI|nr:hypothetical protein B0T25DRAFT_586090 [Lasiosphaeria hispida]
MQLPTFSLLTVLTLGLALVQTADQTRLYARTAEKAIPQGINNVPKANNKDTYPHKFGNNKKLVFSDKCKGKQLWEYPQLRGANISNGGVAPGADRVVFVINGDNPE